MIDVVIVGAGPAGLSCAIEAMKNKLSTLVIDKGGICDCIRRFPTNMTFFSTPELLELSDVPFVSTNTRPSRHEVMQYYRLVVQRKNIPLNLYCTVQSVTKDEHGAFVVQTTQGAILARAVIIATGYFDTTNKLHVPGEELPHVRPYYTEAFEYSGCSVVVVGGKNSAVETALDLWRHGARVQLVHRGDSLADSVKYWQKPDMENRLKAGEIIAHFHSTVKLIRANEVVIENNITKDQISVTADFVIPHIGYRPDEPLLRHCGVQLDPHTLVADINRQTHESNVQGLYLAGSVLCGCKAWNIFIENGREHAFPIIEDIVKKTQKKH